MRKGWKKKWGVMRFVKDTPDSLRTLTSSLFLILILNDFCGNSLRKLGISFLSLHCSTHSWKGIFCIAGFEFFKSKLSEVQCRRVCAVKMTVWSFCEVYVKCNTRQEVVITFLFLWMYRHCLWLQVILWSSIEQKI